MANQGLEDRDVLDRLSIVRTMFEAVRVNVSERKEVRLHDRGAVHGQLNVER